MLQQIYNAALQTPWWVYVLFIYLVKIGFEASKPTVVSLIKMFILPVIFTAMSIHTIMTSFQIAPTVLITWVGSIIIGCLAGWILVRNQEIQIDRQHLLLHLPGTWLTLIFVLIIFASKYYFGYELAADPQLIHQTGFEFSMLFVSGACTGLFIGRAGFYTYLVYTRPSIDLSENKKNT